MKDLDGLFPTQETEVNKIMAVVLKYVDNNELYQLIVEASDIFKQDSLAEIDNIFAGKRYKEGQNIVETVLAFYSGESATWLLTGLAAGLSLAMKKPQILKELK